MTPQQPQQLQQFQQPQHPQQQYNQPFQPIPTQTPTQTQQHTEQSTPTTTPIPQQHTQQTMIQPQTTVTPTGMDTGEGQEDLRQQVARLQDLVVQMQAAQLGRGTERMGETFYTEGPTPYGRYPSQADTASSSSVIPVKPGFIPPPHVPPAPYSGPTGYAGVESPTWYNPPPMVPPYIGVHGMTNPVVPPTPGVYGMAPPYGGFTPPSIPNATTYAVTAA